MASILPNFLWVEREKIAFDIEIEFEIPPYFCFDCNSIGHSSDHCRKDPAKFFSREMVATKNDHAKKIKHDFIPKRHVDIVLDCTKGATDEYTLIIDMTRYKEVATNVPV
jgi:hypothetical protein